MQEIIDNLIAKKLSGNAIESDLAELQAWIGKDPGNAAYFEEARRLWHLSGSLKKTEEAVDTDVPWNEFRALAGMRMQKKRRSPRVLYLRAAAAFFFILVSAFLLVYVIPGEETKLAHAGSVPYHADTIIKLTPVSQLADPPVAGDTGVVATAQEKKTSRARKRHGVVMIAVSSEDSGMVFRLPDNTLVYLNKFSKLTYPEKFSGSQHVVYLSGEAYFEPASGTDLFVHCHDTRTRALGSFFNVKCMRDGVVEISAISGEIEISTENATSLSGVVLKSGEQLLYTASTKNVAKTKVSRKDKWWKKGGFRTMIRNFFNRIIHPRDSSK